MDITYASNKLKKCFEDYGRMQKILSFDWTRKIKKHIDILRASDDFGVFLDVGLGHPEYLQKNDRIQYSMRVDGNVRLIIELHATPGTVRECTEIKIIGVCDYHGGKENWYIS